MIRPPTESYKRFDGPESWDAVVIGSGIGGLTAAMLLAKHGGKRVLVLERHWVAGGFTHSFKRPGYDWDVGVHYLGDLGRPESGTRRMFDEVSGGRIEWAPLPEVYDRIILGDRAYDLVAGKRQFRDRLVSYFPDETAAIDAYIEKLQQAVSGAGGYFAEKAVPPFVALLAGGLMRRKFLRLASRTTREVLEELTSNQELIAVLTGQFGDYGLPPGRSSFGMHAILVSHYLYGAFYPIGGASVIAGEIIPEITSRGGQVLTSAEVRRILVEGKRTTGVEMADGRTIRAPLVISNAGAHITYERLLADDLDATAEQRHAVESLGSSAAHLCLYLGLDQTDRELGLEGTNLWIYPDERHDENISRFLADPGAPLPLVYVSFPSCKDPDFQNRHPGRSTVDVITLASYDWFAGWQDQPWKRRGEDYDKLKMELGSRMLALVEEHVPQIRGHVAFQEVSTPLSTRTMANYSKGEIYGLEHSPARFQERSLKPRTPIGGLYLTGQDICTCGVGGGLFGGAMTASAVLRRPLLSKIVKGRS